MPMALLPPAPPPRRPALPGRGLPTTAVARSSSPTIVASVIVAPSSPPRNGRIVPVILPSTACSSSVTGCSLFAPGGGFGIAHACVPTQVPTKRAAGTAAGWTCPLATLASTRKLPTPNAQLPRCPRFIGPHPIAKTPWRDGQKRAHLSLPCLRQPAREDKRKLTN